MTDNEKFARWQGWQPHPNGKWHRDEFNIWKAGRDLPDYPTDSAACMSLLDTLVEKGYKFVLESVNKGERYVIDIHQNCILGKRVAGAIEPTINQAIIVVCLEVIERERANGKD